MRKSFFLLVIFLISMVLLYGQEQNKPEIQYLQPNDTIQAHYNGSFPDLDSQNHLILVKERDENHVLVELRAWGLAYPDLEWIEEVPENFNYTHSIRKINTVPYFIGKMKGKYGAINEQGEIIIPFIFDKFVDFADEGYYYLIEKKDEKVILPKDDMSAMVFNNITIGLADKNGKVIIPCEYTNIKILDKNRIYAEKYIDTKNQNFLNNVKDPTILPKIRFENYTSNNFTELSSEFKIMDKQGGIIDFSNKVCVPYDNYELLYIDKQPLLYDAVFPKKLNNIQMAIRGKNFVIKKDDNVGCIDFYDNKILIPFEYSHLSAINDKYYYAYKKNETQEGLYELRGIVDCDNNVLIPCEYSNLYVLDDKYLHAEKDRKFAGIIDYHNNTIIPFDYSAYINNNGLYYIDENFIVANSIDKPQSFILDINNNILHSFDDYVMPIYYQNKSAKIVTFSKEILFKGPSIIDLSGKEIIPFCNDYVVTDIGIICRFSSNSSRTSDVIIVSREGKYIFADENVSVSCIGNLFLIVKRNGINERYKMIDSQGNVIIEPNYINFIRPIYKKITIEGIPGDMNVDVLDYKYVAFTNRDKKSVLLNLETLEKKEYDFEIAALDNDGSIYIRELDEKSKQSILVPYKSN